jgi:short-subunit dehydrogenase
MIEDWNWVLGANLWSVIHAHRIFIPRMIAQPDDSHIINTASAAGLASLPGAAAYNVSKHGVVTMSETLFGEFRDCGIKNVGVSVLCPAFVPTKIAESVRPSEFSDTKKHSREGLKYAQNMQVAVKSGKKTADDIAEETFAAIDERQLYILPHKHKIGPLILSRANDIAHERNPSIIPETVKTSE